MSQSDKYPAESGRRRFVKGVVGGAALAGVGAAGSATVNSLTTAGGVGGGQTLAMTIAHTGGPAPRGLPQIPVRVNDDGYLEGIWPEVQSVEEGGIEFDVAREEIGGRTYAGEWFQYCGIESQENIEPSFGSDNVFRSSPGSYDWQDETYNDGDMIHVDDFDDYESWGNNIGNDGVGKPATCTWRSEDADSDLNAVVIRSPRIEAAAEENEWIDASTDQGFMAYLNVCTHFCCIPGYKELEESARYDADDGAYCVCHQSTYDPFTLEEALFVARPRPD